MSLRADVRLPPFFASDPFYSSEQGLGGYIYFKCLIPYLLRSRKLNLYILRLTPFIAVLSNFSEYSQTVDVRLLRTQGLSHFLKDRLTGKTVSTHDELTLEPYELLWLEED